MRVRVLVAGVYNSPGQRAQAAAVGEVIEVAGGGYGASLVADGFVEVAGEERPEPGPSVMPRVVGPRERKRGENSK